MHPSLWLCKSLAVLPSRGTDSHWLMPFSPPGQAAKHHFSPMTCMTSS